MAKENRARYVILGLLAHEILSGYDIKKRIGTRVRYFYDISYGQLYPELTRLEREGLIAREAASSEGRVRKLYSITEAGRRELECWAGSPAEEEKIQYDILLKLFFGADCSLRAIRRHLETFLNRNIAKLAVMAEYEKQLKAVMEEHSCHLYYWLTVLCGRHVFQAHVAWAEEALAILEKMEMSDDGERGRKS